MVHINTKHLYFQDHTLDQEIMRLCSDGTLTLHRLSCTHSGASQETQHTKHLSMNLKGWRLRPIRHHGKRTGHVNVVVLFKNHYI